MFFFNKLDNFFNFADNPMCSNTYKLKEEAPCTRFLIELLNKLKKHITKESENSGST